MQKKIVFRKMLSRLRRLLCLPLAMLAVMSGVTLVQEAHHDFPNSSTIKALAYISPAALWVRGASCSGVSAGASAATIQSALTACNTAGGGTVNAAAGAYSVNGNIVIPCTVSFSGPVLPYQQTHYQTAVFTASGVTQPFHTTAGCGGSSPYQHLSYIEWNGNNQTNGGGGVYIVPGTNGFVVDHNYFHGAGNSSSSQYPGCCSEVQVYLGDGFSSTLTQNVQVTLNEFGPETTSADCGPAMTALSTSSGGGFCDGVASQGQLNQVSIDHNIFHNLEQGAKVAEACTGTNNCQPGTSSYPPGQGNTQNYTMSYNWFYNIQRIPFETQSNYYDTSHPTLQYIQYNVLGNRWNGGGGQQNYDLSIANGCGNPPATNNCTSHVDYNVDVQNVGNSVGGSGFEHWGDSNSAGNYNLFEGHVAYAGGAFDWSQYGAFTYNNNTFNITTGSGTNCQTSTGGYWNHEGGNAPGGLPSCTGNTYSNTGTGTYTSVAPVVSPASGSFAGTHTVTFTNGTSATNRDTNTGIWYTTDGSTPVPGTGTASFITSGSSISTSAATVKAVGMWGAINQPYSYPSGYGYVPSAAVTATYTTGAQYYISPTGSDSNAGTSTSTAWLTPNHAVNCGDTITAAAGNYSSANFYNGKWGTVSCPASNNVAWLMCATFDACKIAATSQQGMYVSASYWGISGWEITDSWQYGNCYYIQPTGPTAVHHVIFANDIANGCAGGGFVAYASTATPAVDYIALIGDIAYGTGSSSSVCASGFSLGFLPQYDSAAGTHLYIAGSFGWGNTNPTSCAGTNATDGEGIIFDTFDKYGYSQQIAAENNIMVGNYGRGIEANNNTGSSPASFFLKNNTLYGNNTQSGQQYPNYLGEEYINGAYQVNATAELAMTSTGTVGGIPIYAYSAEGTNGTSTVAGNWLYSAAGNTTLITSSPGFSFGSNVTGTNPNFTSTTIPGAPSCTGTANTVACVATLINNFTPTASGASTYGYQKPTGASVVDPLYPQWLCNVTLPAGLINPGCGTSTITLTGGYQGNATSAATIAVGAAAIQQYVIGSFSDSSNHQLPYGGYTASFTSSAPTILGLTSSGSTTGVAAGTATSNAVGNPGAISINSWNWTVTAVAATPVMSPTTENFYPSVTVTVTDSTPSAVIYCTTNGTTPTTLSPVYSAPFSFTATTNLQCIAAAPGYTNSAVANNTYTLVNPTLAGVTITLQGGGTSVAAGSAIQACANMSYTSPTENTQVCGSGSDAYGTTPTGWSSSTGNATMSASGYLTGVSAGTTNISVSAGSFTATPVAITITNPLVITNTTLGGKVTFSGNVVIH